VRSRSRSARRSEAELVGVLDDDSIGDSVTVSIWRNDETIRRDVVLSAPVD
jgi:hypothetical protein